MHNKYSVFFICLSGSGSQGQWSFNHFHWLFREQTNTSQEQLVQYF